MSIVVRDRVKQLSATSGTGTITLGATPTGFQSFSVIGDGSTTYYAIVDNNNGEWEVGIGIYTDTGTTLSRDTVLDSSIGGSLVNFGTDNKEVFVTYPADKAVYEQPAGGLFVQGITMGAGSGADINNTAFGLLALNENSGGIGGTAVGRSALEKNTVGSANTAVGINALKDNVDGNENTALGAGALVKNTAGSSNTAVGVGALFDNTTGGVNTAVGADALANNIGGGSNTAVGWSALKDSTAGSNNTAVGTQALAAQTTGDNNTALGASALLQNTTGANNTCVGLQAGVALTTGNNNTILGALPGEAGMANTVLIGAGSTERMRIDSAGNVGIGTSSPGTKLVVAGNVSAEEVNGRFFGFGTTGFSFDGTTVANYGITHTRLPAEFNTVLSGFSNIKFTTGQAERMRITNAGNVGIGTSSPGQKLTISGGQTEIRDGNSLMIRPPDNTNDTRLLALNNGGLDVVWGGALSTSIMRWANDGNVGIGTSTPRAQQHVFGTGQTTSALTDAGNRGGMLRVSDNSSAAGAGGAILFANSQSDSANSVGFAAVKGVLSNGAGNTAGGIAFSTRSATGATSLTERMRISPTGNVGIGTAAPLAALQVAGRIQGSGLSLVYSQTDTGFAQLFDQEASIDVSLTNPGFLYETIYINIFVSATYWNGGTLYNRMTRNFVVTLITNATETATVIANQAADTGYASSSNFPVSRAAVVLVDGLAVLRFARRTSSVVGSITDFTYQILEIRSVV